MVIRNLLVMIVWAMVALPSAVAHDLWVETNISLVQPNDVVDVAFKLGNCDHGKRTFRTTGLLDKSGASTFEIHPNGKRLLISEELVRSSDDASGYWHMAKEIKEPGVTWFCQSLDQLIEHDGQKMRGLVSGKTLVGTLQSSSASAQLKLDTELGFPLEIVPLSTPFASFDETKRMRVKLLLNGKPLGHETISFLPFAVDTKKRSVEDFERQTDEQGIAEFTAAKPGLYLISARHLESGEAQEVPVYYSATLTLRLNKHAAACK